MNEREFYRPEARGSDRGYGDGRYPEQNRSGRLSRLFGGQESPRAPQMQQSRSGGTVIYSPSTYEDVQLLIDHLKMREQVIVDFSEINQTSVYRILDFMSGAIYALNGSIQQITKNIFLFAPSGVTITLPPHLGRR